MLLTIQHGASELLDSAGKLLPVLALLSWETATWDLSAATSSVEAARVTAVTPVGTASLVNCAGAVRESSKSPTVREHGWTFSCAFRGNSMPLKQFWLLEPQKRFSRFRVGMDSGLEGGREGSSSPSPALFPQKALTECTKSPDPTLPRGARGQRCHPAASALLQPRRDSPRDPAAPRDALPVPFLSETPADALPRSAPL